ITRVVVRKAKEGDATALRLIFERIYPLRRGRPFRLEVPPIKTAQDGVAAYDKLLTAMFEGELTSTEATEAGVVLEGRRRYVSEDATEERFRAIENLLNPEKKS